MNLFSFHKRDCKHYLFDVECNFSFTFQNAIGFIIQFLLVAHFTSKEIGQWKCCEKMACTVNIVFKTFFYLQVVHLFRTQFVYADKVDIRSKEIEKEEKISTSLKIESGHSRNKTEKVRQMVVSYFIRARVLSTLAFNRTFIVISGIEGPGTTGPARPKRVAEWKNRNIDLDLVLAVG